MWPPPQSRRGEGPLPDSGSPVVSATAGRTGDVWCPGRPPSLDITPRGWTQPGETGMALLAEGTPWKTTGCSRADVTPPERWGSAWRLMRPAGRARLTASSLTLPPAKAPRPVQGVQQRQPLRSARGPETAPCSRKSTAGGSWRAPGPLPCRCLFSGLFRASSNSWGTGSTLGGPAAACASPPGFPSHLCPGHRQPFAHSGARGERNPASPPAGLRRVLEP